MSTGLESTGTLVTLGSSSPPFLVLRAFFFLYRILNVCSVIYEFDKIEMLAFFHCLQNGNSSRASTRGRQILPDPSAPSPSLSHFQDTRDQDLELLCPVQGHTIQEESTSVTGIEGLDFRGRPLHPHSQHSRLSDYGTTGSSVICSIVPPTSRPKAEAKRIIKTATSEFGASKELSD